MSIRLIQSTDRLMVEQKLECSKILVFDSLRDYESFAQAINRAANLWPNAPVEIKELADILTHGKILQDYKAQSQDHKSHKTCTLST